MKTTADLLSELCNEEDSGVKYLVMKERNINLEFYIHQKHPSKNKREIEIKDFLRSTTPQNIKNL